MKNKFSLLVGVVMIFGFMACKKSTTSAPVNPNPNITVNGTSTDLLGLSKAFYVSKLNNDTIVIVNSSVNDSSVINNISNVSNISSSANFLVLSVLSNNTVSQNTYSGSNVTSYFQVNNVKYKSLPQLSTTIRIDTVNNIFVSGSYSSTVVNLTNPLDVTNPVITGKFRANVVR